MEAIFMLGIFALFLFLFIFIIRIPIIIAKKRGLPESDVGVIVLLSWVSLLLGITWIAALIMSLVCQPAVHDMAEQSTTDNLDELSKLIELKEKGLLSAEEFERAKKRLL